MPPSSPAASAPRPPRPTPAALSCSSPSRSKLSRRGRRSPVLVPPPVGGVVVAPTLKPPNTSPKR
eukprot:1160983-Pelagomonas_calceolata.AAC.7